MIPEKSIETAANHLRDILSLAIKYTPDHAAIVVSDARCPLASALTEAYRRCLPTATFVDFDSVSPADVLNMFKKLVPSDLVVLIQSTSFRMEAFRLRVELFQQSLKVIEHPHL